MTWNQKEKEMWRITKMTSLAARSSSCADCSVLQVWQVRWHVQKLTPTIDSNRRGRGDFAFLFCYRVRTRQCSHHVVSNRLHNSENEKDITGNTEYIDKIIIIHFLMMTIVLIVETNFEYVIDLRKRYEV